MELTYHQEGDCLISDLIIENEKQYSIGKYGSLRRTFLKEHVSGKLLPHLAEVDNEARGYVELLIKQMAKAESVTEELKSRNQMALGWG